MASTVLWFRRDLRLGDNPALLDAAADGADVVPLFVLDPRLWGPAGPRRRAYLAASLAELAASGVPLHVRSGDPAQVVADVARAAGADRVHVAADHGPYGRTRDAAVEGALDADGVGLVRTGSPWAVAPGRLTRSDGSPFSVYSPYARAWLAHGWRDPAPRADEVAWRELPGGTELPAVDPVPDLPAAGEAAALARWRAFVDSADPDSGVAGYAGNREHPAAPGTSRMSAHLKYGEVHPRTLLHDLAGVEAAARHGAQTLRGELAWRDFYADVLFHHPDSAREYLHPQLAGMRWDTGPDADARLAAWRHGRTGYPLVDAGMRQLLATGWMHNRLRMVVASFLVKDLHLEWQHGARWFLRQLVDGELSSNNHGWQWVAGSGTDAAPFFRVFNPTTQAEKFDPDGDYVRRWVPELDHLAGGSVHTPWSTPGAYERGYPPPVVDHATERRETLARWNAVRG